jgi:hypothetical protein
MNNTRVKGKGGIIYPPLPSFDGKNIVLEKYDSNGSLLIEIRDLESILIIEILCEISILSNTYYKIEKD